MEDDNTRQIHRQQAARYAIYPLWVQRDGGPVEEIRPGDVVWFAPGEKHWHGATATTAMSHIAVQEKLNGSPVTWMEKVGDAQYRR